MTALQFLRRTCGKWSSERRYLFAPKFKPVNMTTEFTIDELAYGVFNVDWNGKTNGTMELRLDGDVLHRSRDYFGEGANSSKVQVVDNDTIVLRTEYDGLRFREEVRLIEEDMFRLRQTIGFNIETGQLALAGQYIETRI
tara:strand:+ start:3089 stop:3508 length:420 start_codon:yes stop_codon:yes gene_type:complete